MDGESAKDRELDFRRLKREEPVALQQSAPEAQNLIIPTPGRGEVLRQTQKIAHLIRSRREITSVDRPDEGGFLGSALKPEHRIAMLFGSTHLPGEQGLE